MEMRILNYFLAVAKEGNITKAAEKLHITQPTLSRQLSELEMDLGTQLFIRGKRQVTLTESGLIFQQRSQEILDMMAKTQRDLSNKSDQILGLVTIGCVESKVSELLADAITEFLKLYPKVQFDIFTANGDDLRDKLDQGNIDIAFLLEPVETAKYNLLRLPIIETWGIVVPKNHSLTAKGVAEVEDLKSIPLITSRRSIVLNEIESWIGVGSDKLNIVALQNLLGNSLLLSQRGIAFPICVEGSFTMRPNEELRFIPISPKRTSGHVMAWKKNRLLTPATTLFMNTMIETYSD